MTQFNARCIKGNRASLLDDLFDLAGWHKQKLCIVINEARNEPRTGDTINMHMRTGNPFHFLSPFWYRLFAIYQLVEMHNDCIARLFVVITDRWDIVPMLDNGSLCIFIGQFTKGDYSLSGLQIRKRQLLRD